MNIYYLGSSARGNNPSRPIKILHHIPGTTGGTFISNFAMTDEGLLFRVEYSNQGCHRTHERKEGEWADHPGRIRGISSSRMDTYGANLHCLMGEEHGH